ncbi:MAG: hypothetical protein KDA22_09800, partial [Phycisphaerales bacterium]|nr:hypothetical protein [Phycisphaerales bacterium]
PMEVGAPRRASSAQFVVDRATGAQAAMREAMDPANQSLAEALRLSFRVLQVVIVILIALFLFSGFQTVQEGYTGVRTLFGRIYGAAGDEQIAPGPTLFWPYPVGEIVTVQARRSVDLSKAFWPSFNRQDMTLEQATDRADVSQPIRPGTGGLGDGSLLTADGDLAHVKILAEYTVEDAVGFLDNVDPATIDQIVRMALQRGMVHTAAAFTLNELVELRAEPAAMLREKAQAILDDQLIGAGTNAAGRTRTGVKLSDVQISARTAPLAIRKAYAQVQNAREDAKTAVEMARQEAQKILNGAAGPNFAEVSGQIDAYELALDADRADAPAMLVALGDLLDSERVSGEAARIVSRARAYQAQVDATLGSDAQRFASLLPAYRENPELLVRNLWLQTYTAVLANEFAEVFSMPWNLGSIGVNVESSPEMMQARRRGDMDRKKQEAAGLSAMEGPYLLRGRDIVYDKAGRRLNEAGDTGFGKER